MLRKIGIALFQLLSMIAFTVGFIYLLNAASIPGSYRLFNASAVQITQVYSEATHTALLGLGYLLVAIFIQLALYFGYPRENTQISDLHDEVFELKKLVGRIGSMLQKHREIEG